MIFKGVRLPDELRIALEKGDLVVFAGAGISTTPPSSLPSFDDLVREIAGMKPDDEVKNPEQILGRLVRKNIKVHEAAAKRLLTNTKPTDLHKEILRLFGEAAKVRIVTTNFDNHFTDAAKEVYPEQAVTEYHAPALPLGDDFEGLVYLHGCARIKPLSQVLTDKDFGMAYLTRGWARDFLMSLFARYTVAFVGYSHNDIVVSYLARGMNPADIRPRWVFVPTDIKQEDQDRWAHLEISSVTYLKDATNKDNSYYPLTEFFAAWAKHQQQSMLDHSAVAITLAAGLPPEGDAEAEYLKYCLSVPRLAQDFCNAITHPAWIGWMEKQGLLKAFFTDTLEVRRAAFQSHEAVLSHWLGTYVRKNHPEVLLSLIERNHGVISGPFANQLGQAIFSDKTSAKDPHFTVWLSLLLAKGENCLDRDYWAYLLNKCTIPAHTMVALRIFELLTRPAIQLEKNFELLKLAHEDTDKSASGSDSAPSKQVDYRLDWSSDEEHWITQTWENTLKPNLPQLGEQLAILATKQILDAHYLLRDVGKADDKYDPSSWGISSIAPHEQNQDALYPIVSLLVDVLRELLDHWFTSNRPRALGQMEAWWNSPSLLLRRLVIYGVATDRDRTSDEKLQWLLTNDLIFTYGLKKEVFDVLAAAYAQASDEIRKALIERVEKGHVGEDAKKLGTETLAYESFNVLEWLKRQKPDCAYLQTALEKVRKAHPNFGVREHPDFDHWHGSVGFIDPKEGFDFNQILSEPADNYLNALLGAKESSFRADRWSYLSNLKELFAKDRNWAKGFIDAAVRQGIEDTAIWHNIFSSWTGVLKIHDDWNWMLALIESLPKQAHIYGHAVYLLDHGFWNDELAITPQMSDRGFEITMTAWELNKVLDSKFDGTHQDWLTAAINHTGGWISQCWIHHSNHLKRRKEALPEKLRNAIIEAISGVDAVSVYARIAMTPFVAYLYAWDKALVQDHFLPLYDWKRDRVVAQQTWSVVLHYERGRHQEWEKILIPYYRELAVQMSQLLKQATEEQSQFDSRAQSSLGWHLGSLAMRAYVNPQESGFFQEFLPLLPDSSRTALADVMGKCLKELGVSEREGIWKTWLKEYLENRILGIPIALARGEANEMAEWCLDFGDLFPEIVALVVKMPVSDLWVHKIAETLLASPLLDQFPEAAIDYVLLLLRAEKYPMMHEELKKLHERFKTLISSSQKIRLLEEEMYKRGFKA